jgi:uncharacterized protein DUF4760
MNPEWVTAVGTLGTFVVIAASAVAALLQIRHMRSGNQIAAYNECRETMDSADFRTALNFIRTTLADRLAEPETLERIFAGRLSDEYSGIRMVANLFESMGLFVKTGMMDERIACELWSGIVLDSWRKLEPLTAVLRSRVSEGVWINFEYMAALSEKYSERFPAGEYPRGVHRMRLENRA